MTHAESARYIAAFYKDLGNQEEDFRNYNLCLLVASKIKEGSVLDIGCGAGYLMHLLQMRGNRVFGIEPSEAMVNLARKLNPQLSILQGEAGEIDKFKESFDAVTMIDVLEHIEDDVSQMRAVFEHLKERGKFIIVVPALPFLYGERDRKGGHFRRYSKRELNTKLQSAGFTVLEERHWNIAGTLPYFLWEKVFKMEIPSRIRKKQRTHLGTLLHKLMHAWFRNIENRFSLGFGLSLLCIAEKAEGKPGNMGRPGEIRQQK